MRLRRENEDRIEVATASLNDIMFFLLLFFLIVATFANPNVIKLVLPKAKSSQSITKKQITLSITKDLHYFIDDRAVTTNGLEIELELMKKRIPDVTVVIRPDAEISVQSLVDVLQIGARTNIKMILATRK